MKLLITYHVHALGSSIVLQLILLSQAKGE